jgi:hypothetical protein
MNNRIAKTDMSCNRTYRKIREWLVNCDLNHLRCYNTLSDETGSPSLILDVSVSAISGPDNVRLCRVGGRTILCAALSYCWGEEQPSATLNSNLSTYLLNGIDTSLLPQTIQDAVTVTRRLGIQYLWVDSLCIIQDSDDDKAHEIGRMSQIYSNAYVTISASSSAKCTTGFPENSGPERHRHTRLHGLKHHHSCYYSNNGFI